MLSVKAAADRAGVCASLVYWWVAKKLLPHFRLGKGGTRGKIGIAEADLDAFLNSQRVGSEQIKAAPAPKPPPLKLRHLQL